MDYYIRLYRGGLGVSGEAGRGHTSYIKLVAYRSMKLELKIGVYRGMKMLHTDARD